MQARKLRVSETNIQYVGSKWTSSQNINTTQKYFRGAMNSCFQREKVEIVEFLSLKTEPRVTVTGEEIKYKAWDKLARTYITWYPLHSRTVWCVHMK
jgi:hypothetical protein